MKKVLLATAIALSALGAALPLFTPSVVAQVGVSVTGTELNRAKNSARQMIESLNGGLSGYRAEPAMHGPACRAPFVIDEAGELVFTFQGGLPGSDVFTVESVVRVTRQGLAEVVYNGPIRDGNRAASGAIAPDDRVQNQCATHITLIRAKNLARKAAEAENGGLAQYRAEAAMHGLAMNAPHVANGDGSWTFTFQGGAPGSETLTVESVVTVTQMGEVTVEYNGPVR